jgi:N-acetylneuraminic acid mutarotase
MQARSFVPASALLVLLAALGCREGAELPTAPGVTAPASPQAAVTSNSWITRRDLMTNQSAGFAAAVVPNAAGQSIVYVMGGQTTAGPYETTSKVMAYNVATNTWTTRAPLPAPLRFTNRAAVIDGKIHVSGGERLRSFYQATLYVYDPVTNVWSRKHDMPNTTRDGVTGVIGNRLYVLTSCADTDDCIPRSVMHAFYRYDPATDSWTTLPGPNLPLSGLPNSYRGGVIGGRFYVVWLDRLMVYDPATNQWTTRARMPKVRWDAASAIVAGKLHIIGGYGEQADGRTAAYRTHFVYDPATDTWTTKAPLPTARARIAATRVVVSGKPRIQVVGGDRPANNLQYVP